MAFSLTRCLRRSLGNTPPSTNAAASLKRLLSCPAFSSKEEATAIDMIKYANSLKDDEPSYSEAVRVLEQGLSYFTGDRLPSTMASGRLQLSLATIHANRSNFDAAAECLQQLVNTRSVPLEIKGAAYEALTGLCLQMHQDKAALDHANSFTKLLEETVDSHAAENLRAIKCQALALKRLVELAHTSSNAKFVDLEASLLSDLENASGGAVLAFAESSHVQGSFSLAKNMYEKAISLSKKELEENGQRLSAIAMVPEAVQTGATTGLGQLLAVMGKFEEAETQLTQALKQAEKVKGEKHPQVGVILSCIGNLYHQRGMAQGSSELLLIEGMYKSALDLMKAPPLDKEIDQSGQFMEIVALTRARLGATLAPALYRHSEVKKLKGWVEATWRNSRPLPELLYLKELLSGDNGSKPLREDKSIIGETTVVDVRLGRVFYK